MASPSLPHGVGGGDDDDDDGFDWEAAVREIDSACQNACASTTHQETLARPISARLASAGGCALPAKPGSKPRQSTLDRFVDSFQKRGRNGGASGTPIVRENAPVGYENLDDSGSSTATPAVKIDLEAAKTWIYPVNVPLRDYQFSIAKTALFSNTLVALPTGLGKTLIAAVVMYNYFRWFPEGKIVFTAPSRPLVMQQIEACHNIMGISQEWTIDMTGQMSPPKRSSLWKSKRVFFVTPQVLEKDIQSGICLVKQLVCLVIDEAHRALGNYSYCVAVRELMAVPVQLRILALTATPGSKQQTVQNVIDNLCISTLEYRNESDKDVSPYVHDRKLELIEVAMGKDAVGINNLLLEAIKPFVARLCAIGVLRNRDYATLSPCELLNSRDKFRQAPPLNLPHAKYGEVEGYFGVLITLYHIRKLLSSHGVRPAYEMLAEKLQRGSFARLMSKNETIWKAKLLMQQSLSHGAPSPKLVKMIEILIDHFKEKDPKNSRVIIFSNFRGSVKDIMSSLSNIGESVKATEFIGQSSGKTLKGQSQKMQQAVLQKFRAGGYNVIVATSIGEEGLDIMEVDLVICFDANVSPLRMIQRMGRTGRKHDGRVVVLACEGSELKGYLKKQASSKAVRKHLHNGGVKSFDFHSSPRMIPHICKPEVQFIELSIKQFIPRGKKVKDEAAHHSPFLKRKSDEESVLIARYFHPSKEDTWGPSLIAFPHFQAFPSRVHKVRHSFKTTAMLIDAMQHLQALSCSKAKKTCLIEDGAASSQPRKDLAVALDRNNEEDSIDVQGAAGNIPEAKFEEKISDLKPSSKDEKEGLNMPDLRVQKPSHCFLFGEDLITLDAFGRISIASVPVLPFGRHEASKVRGRYNGTEFQSNTKNHGCSLQKSGSHGGETAQPEDAAGIAISSELRCIDSEEILSSHTPNCGVQKGHGSERALLQTPVSKGNLTDSEDSATETPRNANYVVQASLAGESRGSLKDMELSPRLTHFIEEGIVPESPTFEISHYSSKIENSLCLSLTHKHDNYESNTRCHFVNGHVKRVATRVALFSAVMHNDLGKPPTPCHVSFSGLESKEFSNLNKSELGTVHEIERKESVLGCPVNKEIRTPLAKPKSNSSSEDWQINSEEAAKSVTQAPKFKRLRRYRDIIENLPCKTLKDKFNCFVNSTAQHETRTKLDRAEYKNGKREKAKKYATSFIDEEAEVSEDAQVSEDEEDNENEGGYDDSFIDDRVNPSEASTAENNGGDMLAFYRRSLLTQSPIEVPTRMTMSHESLSPRTTESGSCSLKQVTGSHQTPQDNLNSAKHSTGLDSVTCQLDSERVIVPAETSSSQKECSNKLENRKRKLNFQHAGSTQATNFQQEQVFQSQQAGKVSWHDQLKNIEISPRLLCDDDFYQCLDLDELEAQATKLVKYKSESSMNEVHRMFPNSSSDIKAGSGVTLLSSPSFDLGV